MKFYNKYLKLNLWFNIFASTSIILLVASFCLPPTGVIDPSVMAGVGELFAFAALWEVYRAIDKGIDAKITHNNTSIELQNDEKEGE